MKKKFASLFLAMALVVTMIPATAFAGTAKAAVTYPHTTTHVDYEGNVLNDAYEGFSNVYGVELATTKAEYAIGEDIRVMVTGTANMKDSWIGLYADIGANKAIGDGAMWEYTNNKDGEVVLSGARVKEAVGAYEGIYYVGCKDDEGRWAMLPIKIGAQDYDLVLDGAEMLDPPLDTSGYASYAAYNLGGAMDISVKAPTTAANDMFVGVYNVVGYSASEAWRNVKANANGAAFNLLDSNVVYAEGVTGLTRGPYALILYSDADRTMALDIEYIYARRDVSASEVTVTNNKVTYTGDVVVPTVTVTDCDEDKTMKDRHYKVLPTTGGVNVGAHKAYVQYYREVGGKSGTFDYTIVAKNIADADVTVSVADIAEGATPSPVVKYNNKTLQAGTDYTVEYKADMTTFTGTATFTGKDNFTGTKTATYKIQCAHSWKDATCTAPKTCSKCKATTGSALSHDWKDATCAAPKTCQRAGCGATEGTKTNNHSYGTPVVTKTPTCTTAGQQVATCSTCKAQSPSAIGATGHKWVDVPAKAATCTETGLTAGKQCETCKTWMTMQATVEKLAHTPATSAVTKKATAKADGEITNYCACGAVAGTEPIAKAVVTFKNATYTGKKVKAPTPIVKDANGKTIAKANYTVVAPKNAKNMKDIGRYAYTIKFKGDTYSGSTKVYFQIQPAKVKIKAPAAAKKAVTVKWTKAAKKEKVTGYEVMYATNNKFTKGKKTVTVKGAAKVSKKVTKLKSKTKYFVKVRSYKTVKGVKIYSDWSAVKSIKAK